MRYSMILLLAVLISGQACTQSPSSTTDDRSVNALSGPVLSAAEFKAAIDKGNALLIDVRTPNEYASGHIAGSRNLDWTATDYEEKFAGLEKGPPILVYCAIGGRSDQARAYLQEKGHIVLELEDGIKGWKEAGLPLVRD